MTDTYKVIQADRIAAERMYRFVQGCMKAEKRHSEDLTKRTSAQILDGRWDKDESVQAFAKHREDTEARCSFLFRSPPEISARSGVAPYSGRFTRPSIDGKHLDQWYAKVNGQVVIPDADGGFAAQAGDVVEIIPGMPESDNAITSE